MSPATLKLAKFSALVMLLCSIHYTAGSCKYYGHSCWGAHGKRNGNVMSSDSIAASSEDVPNFSLLDRFFRGTTGGQNDNGAPYENRESINKGQLVNNGEHIRPWKDDSWKEEGKWQASEGDMDSDGGHGADNEKIINDINSQLMENNLMENGMYGNKYLTRYSFTPLEETKLRYLLKKHLSKYN